MNIVPNRICEGIGETPLAQRLEPWTAQARQWFYENICPQPLTEQIISDEQEAANPSHPQISSLIQRVIDAKTLFDAAPALDVTMHPNGLAVVSTDSLAPASAERSREFRLSIMKLLMQSAHSCVAMLYNFEQWRESKPAQDIWLATTINDPIRATKLAGLPYDWDSFIRAIDKIRAVEDKYEQSVFSEPLLARLRQDSFFYPSSAERKLYRTISHIISISHDETIKPTERRLRINFYTDRFVNICQDNAITDWMQSTTAKLYQPEIFSNKKESSGYFF